MPSISVAVFDEAAVRGGIDAERAERHRDLTGAFDILRAPAYEIARVELKRRKHGERRIHGLSHSRLARCTVGFERIGIAFFLIVVWRERLNSHGGYIGVCRTAGEGKAAVAKLL